MTVHFTPFRLFHSKLSKEKNRIFLRTLQALPLHLQPHLLLGLRKSNQICKLQKKGQSKKKVIQSAKMYVRKDV